MCKSYPSPNGCSAKWDDTSVGKYNICRVKTEYSAGLTVMSGTENLHDYNWMFWLVRSTVMVGIIVEGGQL